MSDITEAFKRLPKESQKAALENGWTYFTYAFQYENFQKKLLNEFPSLNILGQEPTLLGRTPLDLRFLYKKEINPAALLLAIDLEMELLSRFHSNQQSSPRCLEDFWSEWGLPIPRSQISRTPLVETLLRSPSNKPIETAPGIALNERSKRLALYLKQSLALTSDTKLKLLAFDEARARFQVNDAELFEIFSSPTDCKSLQEKKYLIPHLGKMKCLQKQSATWITVSAKETTVVSDNWVSEVRHRCQKWVRPLSDFANKENLQLRESPLGRAWSLYPRLRNFIQTEANRYEASFRNSLQ